jgi:cation-transporting ATPase E
MKAGVGGLFGRSDGRSDANDDLPEEPPAPQGQLLFAYSPEPQSLVGGDGGPVLPSPLIPLCSLTFSEKVRPEAGEAIKTFIETGVQVKLLTRDDAESARDAVNKILPDQEFAQLLTVAAGGELATMDSDRLAQSVQEAAIFAQVTAEQKAEVIGELRRQGEYVAMVGDGVHDVPTMQQANLSIAFRSSSQAALNTADIVLMDDSLELLPRVLQSGQRTVNNLMDTLRLNLSQIGYLVLLLVTILIAGGRDFYYHPSHSGAISFFTLGATGTAFALWSVGRAVPRDNLRPRLFHFAVPAALATTIAVLVIDEIFRRSGADVTTSQNAVTFGVIVMGLVLFLFVQPPVRALAGGNVYSGDRRYTYLALALLVLYFILAATILGYWLFKIELLPQASDYFAIGGVVVVWAFVLLAVWRSRLLQRYVDLNPKEQAED